MRGVACDPSLPYDPAFRPAEPPPERPVPVSRPNFIELCGEVTRLLERSYFELWSTLGLSVDWDLTYETIGARARRVSQLGFLDLLARGLAYRAEAPTLWDVDFRTAIAQAELEDREIPGSYHRLRFERPDRGPVWVDTTRPELLPACVALVAHPDDARYRSLVGTAVTTPVFGARVPVAAHPLADPAKGTGLAMICTFGDTTDVVWWRELGLPVRSILGRDGRLAPLPPEGVDPAAYEQLAGRTVRQARARTVELLREAGALDGEPRPITHPVKFWENGSRPLEIVTSRQWFIRYPGKADLLRHGRQVRWHPAFMRARYLNWVEGLVGDWNVSRQRFFGVPFPIWYPVGDDGQVRWDAPIAAAAERLPVDPSTDAPDGYAAEQRDRPGGFSADPDVMDTWATSSLTPQLVTGWADDEDLFRRTFPMDLRPQAHEIIRTWLFYTIVRSHYLHGAPPWSDAAISGFVVDPERKKLSKSAANAADDPMALIDRYGADAIRYWAAKGRLGADVALDHNQFKVGRKLAVKLLNAGRFVLAIEPPASADGAAAAAVDRALLAALAEVVAAATQAFEDYDAARALERAESFFWHFCDDYLELVKARAYGALGPEGAASAAAALRGALSVLLRLLAPFLPFVTEEVWSWWQDGSVHRAPWPTAAELADGAGNAAVLASAADVLGRIRKAKSAAKRSMRAPVERVVVSDTPERVAALRRALDDLRAADNVAEIRLVEADRFAVDVRLAPAG
jgi:valyl-tRNA synthetase